MILVIGCDESFFREIPQLLDQTPWIRPADIERAASLDEALTHLQAHPPQFVIYAPSQSEQTVSLARRHLYRNFIPEMRYGDVTLWKARR